MGNSPPFASPASGPLPETAFCAWVVQAAPGDRLEYYQGFLVVDAFPALGGLPEQERQALVRLASRAFWAAEHGLVHLVQERIGPERFSYLAIARPRTKAATAKISEILTEEKPE